MCKHTCTGIKRRVRHANNFSLTIWTAIVLVLPELLPASSVTTEICHVCSTRTGFPPCDQCIVEEHLLQFPDEQRKEQIIKRYTGRQQVSSRPHIARALFLIHAASTFYWSTSKFAQLWLVGCVDTCLHNLTDKIWSIFRQSVLCRFLIFRSCDKRGLKQWKKKKENKLTTLYQRTVEKPPAILKIKQGLTKKLHAALTVWLSWTSRVAKPVNQSIKQTINQSVRAVNTWV